MFSINKVDSFPELTRSGRVNTELQEIINALIESANTGSKFALSGVEPGKAYNSMQQRIRAQSRKLNFKVIIRYSADDQTLYFKAGRAKGQDFVDVVPFEMSDSEIIEPDMADEMSINHESALSVKSSDVKTVKTKNSQSSAN
jgi:hypothetical protein